MTGELQREMEGDQVAQRAVGIHNKFITSAVSNAIASNDPVSYIM